MDKEPNEKNPAMRGGHFEEDLKDETSHTGQMFSIFGCRAGGAVTADSTLSVYILNEGKEQIAQTGMFTTLNNKLLRASIKNAEVTDCTTLNLVWRPQQENIAL